MSMYGGSVVGQKAIWGCKTGYHAQYYGGPVIGGVPDRMDVEDGAPTTAEASGARKKGKGGPSDDEHASLYDE